MSARSVRERLREQFILHAEQTAVAITHRMSEYEAVLRSGVALFVSSQLVTRSDFHRFCEHLEVARFYPGFQGVAFAKHVRRGELEAFVSEVRAEGFPGFTVHPEGERETYMPILYIEPFAGRNLRAFGYDMFSEEKRQAAMQRSWSTGSASATPVLRLIQDAGEVRPRRGFLIYLPVFMGAASSAAERRQNLFGFVYSAVLVSDLMRGILGKGPSDQDIALYDGDSQESFFDTRSPAEREVRPEFEHRRPLVVAGHPWNLRVWSRPSFANWVSRDEPLRLLGAGIVINLLLFYILGTSASLQRKAQTIAAGITEQLQRSHEREQTQMRDSLREKETLLRELHHRVKNNLQVISSLLSLQSNQAADPRAAEPLRQSQHRVLALAALHDFLVQATDLSRVDVRGYLRHVVGVLSQAYQTQGHVDVQLEIEPVDLDVDQAISCGLITNELVSNAFKYAFVEGRKGKLRVRLHGADEGALALEVEDDGPSLPSHVSMADPTTLGLQVVELLTQQLGGRIKLSREGGAHFRVIFPAKGARA